MMWHQIELKLHERGRGFHLITSEVCDALPEIAKIQKGLLQLFIKHTSASLAINEDADPSVRTDLESHFNQMVPENARYYTHTDEGSDDMPAHIKSCLLGSNITIPITGGRLNLGTWQGVYLCEHRNFGGARKLVLTIHGEL